MRVHVRTMTSRPHQSVLLASASVNSSTAWCRAHGGRHGLVDHKCVECTRYAAGVLHSCGLA